MLLLAVHLCGILALRAVGGAARAVVTTTTRLLRVVLVTWRGPRRSDRAQRVVVVALRRDAASEVCVPRTP